MKILQPPVSLPSAEHEKRLRALLRTLKKEKLDGALIASETARFYYTGFRRLGVRLIYVDGSRNFF